MGLSQRERSIDPGGFVRRNRNSVADERLKAGRLNPNPISPWPELRHHEVAGLVGRSMILLALVLGDHLHRGFENRLLTRICNCAGDGSIIRLAEECALENENRQDIRQTTGPM